MGYTADAIKGFGWQSSATVLAAGITVLKLMILARILSQQDFGLFALVTIAIGLTEAITQTGINITIIQSKHPVSYFLNTAWVIAIFRGLIIALIMAMMGVGMANFYAEPSLVFLVALAAFVPLIKGFINPAIVSWQKELQFGSDTIFRLVLVAIEAVAAVTLAVVWRSVETLIIALIVAAVAEVLLSFTLLKLRPAFKLSKSKAKMILSNAKGLGLAAALDYSTENVDELILGRTLGTRLLGSYHAGYALSHRPTVGFAQALNHSTLPVFTRIGEDTKRLKQAFFKSSGSLILLTLIAVTPLIFFPELVVRVILGEKWLNIVPLLPWLAMAGLLQAVIKLGYNVLISQKKYQVMNWHRAITLLMLVPLLVVLSQQYGLTGAGIAWVITRTVPLPLLLLGIIRLLK